MSTSTIAAPAGTWQLDTVHSSVEFQVPYGAGNFKGTFRDFDGTAKVASVDVKSDDLAAHLQSPDFFDAETHPELRFAADRIALDGDAVQVTGEITIKGVTKAVTATGSASEPVTNIQGLESVALTLTATVDRTEFGVSWNAELPGGGQALRNEVTIHAELYFVKEA
jgi:polyisoprenoid-binding protein YceI